MPDQDYETRFLVSSEESDHGWGTVYLRLKAYPVKVLPDGDIRNFSDHSWPREPLADLIIGAQVDNSGLRDPYGWDKGPTYEHPYEVTLDRAEAMVKTLRRINRGLDKIRAEYGYPETY